MRFYGLALLAGAAMLSACSGGGEKKADSTPVATTPTPTPPPTGAAVAKVAATGADHEIKMVGDDKGYRFEPADVTLQSGDAVTFVMVTGGPHNVAFDPNTTPAGGKAQLDANMDSKLAELSSPMLQNPNEKYTISFGGVAPGVYPFHCTPHLAMNMKGTNPVQ